jgi:hypothetical protein
MYIHIYIYIFVCVCVNISEEVAAYIFILIQEYNIASSSDILGLMSAYTASYTKKRIFIGIAVTCSNLIRIYEHRICMERANEHCSHG